MVCVCVREILVPLARTHAKMGQHAKTEQGQPSARAPLGLWAPLVKTQVFKTPPCM